MKRSVSVAAAAALSFVAVGTAAASTPPGSAPPASESQATTPVTEVTVAPARIISLSPAATETLFAIGAGPQVIAVDEYSNFPAETQSIQHDLSGYTPNIEAIASLKPDLVVHEGSTELDEQLSKLNIADFVASAPADLDGVFAQIEQLGAVTGHLAEAAALVGEMRTKINAALGLDPTANPGDIVLPGETTPANAPAIAASGPGVGATYFHELDNTLYTATSETFIGQIYGMFGMVNIADASSADNPYPQLSAETVITADPQVIFLADGGFGESADTVAARPGWAAIDAVKNGNVVALDPDVASRWGPRVVDLVTFVAETVAKLPASASA